MALLKRAVARFTAQQFIRFSFLGFAPLHPRLYAFACSAGWGLGFLANFRSIILLGPADKLRGDPAQQNQHCQHGPAVFLAVGDAGKVIANHDKDQRHSHEGVLL